VKLAGNLALPVDAQTLWDMLQDPALLAELMPGCKQMKRTSEDQFTGIIETKVGPIASQYTTKFSILDKKPPHSYRLQIEGSGKGGFVRADALVSLQSNTDGTILNYSGDATIGGTISRVGQRLVDAAAKMLINRGFKTLREKVEERLK
jgi:hypothetical protein